MTTESKPQDLHLRRRERRPVPPFGDGSNPGQVSQAIRSALDPCRFAPFPDSPLTNDKTYILQPHEYEKRIEPRFKLQLDNADELALSVGATSNDLCLSISARDRHIKRYLALKQWGLDGMPEAWTPNPKLLGRFQGRRDLNFILAIRVVSDNPRLRQNGLEPGKVLSRREFVIRKPTDLSFPFEWIDNSRKSSGNTPTILLQGS